MWPTAVAGAVSVADENGYAVVAEAGTGVLAGTGVAAGVAEVGAVAAGDGGDTAWMTA